ncbi:MAG TPA: mechanosensitive ion channel family protein [Gemmatimonadaceae bacterium]|nr:mechanosensitive ion channel family protein [Gemmatimonadaceae bacterium]
MRPFLSLLTALLVTSAVAGAQPGAAGIPGRPLADSTAQAAPLVIRGDTALLVPTRFGAFTAAQRAEAIAARLRGLTRVRLDSLGIVVGERGSDITAGDVILMTVTDDDAAATGVPRDVLAAQFRDALWAQVNKVSFVETVRVIAIGALLTLLATLVLVVLLRLVRRGIARGEAILEARKDGGLPSLRIKTLEILTAEQVAQGLAATLRFLRVAVILLLLYFYLPLILGFFPWTAPYADRLLGYVLDPLGRVGWGVLEFLPNIAFIAVIIVVTRYALVVVKAVFTAVERGTLTLGGFEPEWAEPTYKIARFLVIAFVLVVIFPYLPGAQSEAFKGISLFLGLLVSLGSSSAISNIIAGVVLTYTRAFSVGDRVRIGESTGDVVAKTLLVTRLRTIKNVDVTIPNAMVLSAHVLNFTAMARAEGLVVHTTVTIGYDVPWTKVHETLIAAAGRVPGLLGDPKPYVLQTAMGDFSVAYEINAMTREARDLAQVYSALHAAIQDEFNAAGIEIMSPQYHALRDGNASTIPAQHLPADYRAPAFRAQRSEG